LRASEYLSWALLVNEYGEVLPLEKVYAASVRNPELRRLELMTRMAGCERTAQRAGDEVMLCTVTLPGRFHAVHSMSGKPNARFDGSTPRPGHRQLQSSWAKVRAALGRAKVSIYGFRCAEPNHDGTVHWHLMICVRPEHADQVRGTITHYFLDEIDPDEPRARERRVSFIEIDRERGSAVGYLAKYISKNIDGVALSGRRVTHYSDPLCQGSCRPLPFFQSLRGFALFLAEPTASASNNRRLMITVRHSSRNGSV
jgi:hypothetical protein